MDIAEDAAFAPARQLGDGRRAGSVHMHMSAVEVDPVYVADARVARDWSLFGGDAAEGVVAVVVDVDDLGDVNGHSSKRLPALGYFDDWALQMWVRFQW